MIELTVKKHYGERTVLDINSLTFEEHKRYAIVGANGSGKTTLLKIIGNLEKADKGYDIDKIFELNKKDICYMPQSSFAFSMSLTRNVFLACPDLPRIKNKNTRVFYNDRCHKLIYDMGLWKLRYKNAAKLSGGETQRMAMCRALVAKHDILLLDEPTSSMDVSATAIAEKVLEQYCAEFHPTVIFATHSIRQAIRFADEVIFMSEGKVVERGASNTLFDNPQSDELKAFLENM